MIRDCDVPRWKCFAVANIRIIRLSQTKRCTSSTTCVTFHQTSQQQDFDNYTINRVPCKYHATETKPHNHIQLDHLCILQRFLSLTFWRFTLEFKKMASSEGDYPVFEIERYFSKRMFNTKHVMCSSNAEPMKMKELLSYADEECKQLW